MKTAIRRQWRGVLFPVAIAMLMVPAAPTLAQGRGNQDQQSIAQSFQIFDNGEAVRLPLYEGIGPEGDTVWFVITEASTEEAARWFGVTHAPKLNSVGDSAFRSPALPISPDRTTLDDPTGTHSLVAVSEATMSFFPLQAVRPSLRDLDHLLPQAQGMELN